jgi:hypothetical protein
VSRDGALGRGELGGDVPDRSTALGEAMDDLVRSAAVRSAY